MHAGCFNVYANVRFRYCLGVSSCFNWSSWDVPPEPSVLILAQSRNVTIGLGPLLGGLAAYNKYQMLPRFVILYGSKDERYILETKVSIFL